MTRFFAYLSSIIFLIGFFFFDIRTTIYDAAIPYFAAVLFALWSTKRIDIVIVSILCLIATIVGGYYSPDDETLKTSIQAIVLQRSFSIFALVCVAYVSWQRRGMSLRLQEVNELLERRVDVSEKEATEMQQQLSEAALTLDQQTV